jgi:hypothetical protein
VSQTLEHLANQEEGELTASLEVEKIPAELIQAGGEHYVLSAINSLILLRTKKS